MATILYQKDVKVYIENLNIIMSAELEGRYRPSDVVLNQPCPFLSRLSSGHIVIIAALD